MTAYFKVWGKPQGKGRPRFTRRGGVYTPEQTVHYEDYVRLCYSQQCAKMLAGEIRPVVKPDGDNIQKIIADALNGVAYKDDNAIVDWHCQKLYAEVEGVFVKIQNVAEDL